jgi:hypothetical protein
MHKQRATEKPGASPLNPVTDIGDQCGDKRGCEAGTNVFGDIALAIE